MVYQFVQGDGGYYVVATSFSSRCSRRVVMFLLRLRSPSVCVVTEGEGKGGCSRCGGFVSSGRGEGGDRANWMGGGGMVELCTSLLVVVLL